MNSSKITIVTGLWDIGRSNLSEGWSRSFDHYIAKFKDLLKNVDHNMIIFGDNDIMPIINEYRSEDNTQFIHRPLSWFKSNTFIYENIQKIRNNPEWYNQVGWLKDSTQAKLEMYNPLVMSKMFLLNDAFISDKFDSEYIFWLDAGITNTIHPGYFSKDRVLDKVKNFTDQFLFICFPYETTTEIHGFEINAMNRYSGAKVNRVARGGFFGGLKENIPEANKLYYDLLSSSLSEGLMGTEESIFTIMTYLEPQTYKYEKINGDGLLSTFFERVKNSKTNEPIISNSSDLSQKPTNNKVSIYINTFNSVSQLKLLIDSFNKYDKKFITDTDIVIINNTIDKNALKEYDEFFQDGTFKVVQEGNKGICGARQWAAEDFAKTNNKYMMFFEDDMLLDLDKNRVCGFGFSKFVNNLYTNVIKIMDKENYDFLKLSFSEFFGHNGEQWSWHNLPKDKKQKYFGDIKKRPHTNFTNIKSLNSVVYAEGEVYYSNWPHIINQRGNQKCFIDTKWAHPYEQTWMSHLYMLLKEEKIKPAILLHSPITHNRVFHYRKEERKES